MSPEVNNSVIARPLAEEVSADIVSEAVERYTARRTPAGFLHSAWHHVEYAMNKDCPEIAAPYYLESAEYLIGKIIVKPEAHQDTKLGALILSTYMPVLSKRAGEESVEKEDCESVYRSMGYALRFMRPLNLDEPPQWRMVEAATLALSARIGRPELLLYPSSPREEQSREQEFNHDAYFYTGTDKIPIQQKIQATQKTYDECITMLTIDPIIDKALRTTRQSSERSLSDKINYLLALIVAETANEKISRQERRFLNILTQAIAAHHGQIVSAGRGDVVPQAA